MRVLLFMTLLLAGILCLVAGMFVTRQTWRPDIAPFGRGSRMFHIALHPSWPTTSRLHSTSHLRSGRKERFNAGGKH